MVSMSYAFRLGKSAFSNVIRETCLALWDVLKAEVLSPPNKNDWKERDWSRF